MLTKKTRRETRNGRCAENVHFIHDCCSLQQVAMAEKVSAFEGEGEGNFISEKELGDSPQDFAPITLMPTKTANHIKKATR